MRSHECVKNVYYRFLRQAFKSGSNYSGTSILWTPKWPKWKKMRVHVQRYKLNKFWFLWCLYIMEVSARRDSTLPVFMEQMYLPLTLLLTMLSESRSVHIKNHFYQHSQEGNVVSQKLSVVFLKKNIIFCTALYTCSECKWPWTHFVPHLKCVHCFVNWKFDIPESIPLHFAILCFAVVTDSRNNTTTLLQWEKWMWN